MAEKENKSAIEKFYEFLDSRDKIQEDTIKKYTKLKYLLLKKEYTSEALERILKFESTINSLNNKHEDALFILKNIHDLKNHDELTDIINENLSTLYKDSELIEAINGVIRNAMKLEQISKKIKSGESVKQEYFKKFLDASPLTENEKSEVLFKDINDAFDIDISEHEMKSIVGLKRQYNQIERRIKDIIEEHSDIDIENLTEEEIKESEEYYLPIKTVGTLINGCDVTIVTKCNIIDMVRCINLIEKLKEKSIISDTNDQLLIAKEYDDFNDALISLQSDLLVMEELEELGVVLKI